MNRLQYFEGDLVKFALGNDEDLIVTLVYSTEFKNEMEMRISNSQERFLFRGHKSIMDKWTFEEFERKVEYNLKLRKLLP